MNKKVIDDLAIFGGMRLFDSVKPIGQLATPNKDNFFKLLKNVYDRRVLTNDGPLNRELELRLAKMHDVEFCITFSSASLALIILIDTLSSGKNGNVIMPAFTYVGLPHLAQWAGQKPLFCDVNITTHTIDPAQVEASINADTSVILAVHQVTDLCDIEALESISENYSVPLIFDSVHAIGCEYNGAPTGSSGKAEIFSLHATKILNGFEGGYVTTNDAAIANTLRLKRNFCFDESRNVHCLGMNAKLNEIHAACALTSLDEMLSVIELNKERYCAYVSAFEEIPYTKILEYNVDKPNYEFALISIEEDSPLSRDTLVDIMRAEFALARPYYSPPVHLTDHNPNLTSTSILKNTERLASNIIQMPVGNMVEIEDIYIISELFRFAFENSDHILRKMGA